METQNFIIKYAEEDVLHFVPMTHREAVAEFIVDTYDATGLLPNYLLNPKGESIERQLKVKEVEAIRKELAPIEEQRVRSFMLLRRLFNFNQKNGRIQGHHHRNAR